MPFDPLLGVGHETRAQPAIITTSQELTWGNGSGAFDQTVTLTIPDDVNVQFMQFVVSSVPNTDGNNISITVTRNDAVFDKVDWNVGLDDITTLYGSGVIYSYAQQRLDFLRSGDTIKVRIKNSASAPNPSTTHTFTVVMSIIGTWA